MGEHMQAIQDDMTMMNGMTARGAGGMGDVKGSAQGDLAARHQMLEKRMEMMQTTMQLMRDRVPAVLAK